MKTFLILSFFIFTIHISADEVTWINEQIEAIKPPRSGVSSAEINSLKDPFIFLGKNTSKGTSASNKNLATRSTGSKAGSTAKRGSRYRTSKAFKLDVIINSSALINSKWYKLNEKINGYTVSEISRNSVLLTNKGKKILLSTKSNILNLKLKSK